MSNEITGLFCPECKAPLQINLPGGSPMMDIADLSRERRANGAAFGVEEGIGVIQCQACKYEGDPVEFDVRSLLPKVRECYIALDGMIAAFDEDEKNVPECQGFILVVGPELKIRCDEKTRFYMGAGSRRGSFTEANFSWWFGNE